MRQGPEYHQHSVRWLCAGSYQTPVVGVPLELADWLDQFESITWIENDDNTITLVPGNY